MEILIWTLSLALMLVGVAGVLVPLLPGTALILVAAILHRLFLPESLEWSTVTWIGVIWLVSVAADFAGVMIGTKLFGGGKWGMAGATTGTLIGMFFSLRAMILATVLGAIAAEHFIAKKSGRVSLLAGVGATTGFLLSTFLRLGCAGAMISVFLAGAL